MKNLPLPNEMPRDSAAAELGTVPGPDNGYHGVICLHTLLCNFPVR